MKKNSKEEGGNPHKESAYGVYHNGLIDMMGMLCASNHPQEKVKIAMNMIVNMRSEIAIRSENISKKLTRQK